MTKREISTTELVKGLLEWAQAVTEGYDTNHLTMTIQISDIEMRSGTARSPALLGDLPILGNAPNLPLRKPLSPALSTVMLYTKQGRWPSCP